MENPFNQESYVNGMRRLVQVVQSLSLAESLEGVVEVVKHAARELTGADGATFVLKDREFCHYVDEDAIAPLWKGKRFPLEACVSGWAMNHRRAAIIPDIYADSRVPADAYRPTFVKSMVMVPIRQENPIGAIGNYWAHPHEPTEQEVELLQSLADSTSIALANVQLWANLRKSLEQERLAHLEVERQLSLRDEFISVAAHELKTPLTPVLIHVQVLQKMLGGEGVNLPAPERISRSVKSIEKQFRRFAGLVENLLDASRIRLGKLVVEPKAGVNLGELIARVAEEFRPISTSLIGVQVEVGGGGDLLGEWDAPRLEQVIANLLSNAIHYGEGKPIEIGAAVCGDFVEIFCRDEGVGIAKDAQERIFGRFERASKMESYGGLGLGLFIVRQIVHQHGGTIWVESEPGEGTTFWVRLPRSAEGGSLPRAG